MRRKARRAHTALCRSCSASVTVGQIYPAFPASSSPGTAARGVARALAVLTYPRGVVAFPHARIGVGYARSLENESRAPHMSSVPVAASASALSRAARRSAFTRLHSGLCTSQCAT